MTFIEDPYFNKPGSLRIILQSCKGSCDPQVLVSIQSMIFIEDPYFNEPGHEATAGSSQGQAKSTAYNRNICAQNLRHALLPAVLKPPPAFKELLKCATLSPKLLTLKPRQLILFWIYTTGTSAPKTCATRCCRPF